MPRTRRLLKVFRRSPRGLLWSAIVRNKRIRMRYSEDEVNLAPDGRHFLAFETEAQARDFTGNHHSQMREGDRKKPWLPSRRQVYAPEIWEVEATGVKPLPYIAWDWQSVAAIKRFWQKVHGYPANVPLGSTSPPGTVSCQTIKLVRKVA